MKKVFTLALVLFLCSAAFAQFSNTKSGSRGGDSGGIDFGETFYKGFVEAGYAVGLGDQSSVGKLSVGRFDISTSHGVQFGGRFFAGLGTGVKFFMGAKYDSGRGEKFEGEDDFISIPIFADFRANLFKDNSINPFIGLKIGYSIGFEKEKDCGWLGYQDVIACKEQFGGFICTPAIGCRFGINEEMGFDVSIGYDLQMVDWKYKSRHGWTGLDSDSGTAIANGLVFKVGIDF